MFDALELLSRFPRWQCRLLISPMGDDMYKVGYEYRITGRHKRCDDVLASGTFIPGSGSYYELDEAMFRAWMAYQMIPCATLPTIRSVYTQWWLNEAMQDM